MNHPNRSAHEVVRRGIRIRGTGSAFPKRALTSVELEKQLHLTEGWIESRTGISTRYIADASRPEESCAGLGAQAARQAIMAAQSHPSNAGSEFKIDAIFVATITPDSATPSVACLVQKELGISGAWAMDLNAACAGFVYAFSTAESFIRSGQITRALVIGVDVLSRLVDWQDPATAVLFGDGAGAVVLESVPIEEDQVLDTHLIADPIGADLLVMGSPAPQAAAHVVMNGREVFRHSVKTLSEIVDRRLKVIGATADQVRWVVPHQANLRIIESVAKHLDLAMDRFIVNIGDYGNTSAATIPTALDGAVRAGRFKSNELIVLDAFGGGFTAGVILLKW